jgi:hypothetical protein
MLTAGLLVAVILGTALFPTQTYWQVLWFEIGPSFASQLFHGAVAVILGVILAVGLMFAAPVGMAYGVGCPDCDKRMRRFEIGPLPVRCEHDLVESLRCGDLESAAALPLTAKIDMNFSTVRVWICKQCNNWALINVETTQMRTARKRKDNKVEASDSTQKRLPFSTALAGDDVGRVKQLCERRTECASPPGQTATGESKSVGYLG